MPAPCPPDSDLPSLAPVTIRYLDGASKYSVAGMLGQLPRRGPEHFVGRNGLAGSLHWRQVLIAGPKLKKSFRKLSGRMKLPPSDPAGHLPHQKQ